MTTATSARASQRPPSPPAASSNQAPTTVTPETALVIDINGVCSRGGILRIKRIPIAKVTANTPIKTAISPINQPPWLPLPGGLPGSVAVQTPDKPARP